MFVNLEYPASSKLIKRLLNIDMFSANPFMLLYLSLHILIWMARSCVGNMTPYLSCNFPTLSLQTQISRTSEHLFSHAKHYKILSNMIPIDFLYIPPNYSNIALCHGNKHSSDEVNSIVLIHGIFDLLLSFKG